MRCCVALECDVSTDPVIGINQSNHQLWMRIKEQFDSDPAIESIYANGYERRFASSLASRCKTIQKAVCKFLRAMKKANATAASGQSEKDIYENSHIIYRATQRDRKEVI